MPRKLIRHQRQRRTTRPRQQSIHQRSRYDNSGKYPRERNHGGQASAGKRRASVAAKYSLPPHQVTNKLQRQSIRSAKTHRRQSICRRSDKGSAKHRRRSDHTIGQTQALKDMRRAQAQPKRSIANRMNCRSTNDTDDHAQHRGGRQPRARHDMELQRQRLQGGLRRR